MAAQRTNKIKSVSQTTQEMGNAALYTLCLTVTRSLLLQKRKIIILKSGLTFLVISCPDISLDLAWRRNDWTFQKSGVSSF